jgi:hypothetical protein
MLMAATPMLLVCPAMGSPLPSLPPLPVLGETVILHDQAGIALRGYDPVAYFAEGRAVGGSPAFELQHEGLVWRFASGANMAAFAAEPKAYMPAFGGHDATAIARGRVVDSEPRWFLIDDQRLYLFRTREGRDQYQIDADLRQEARSAWTKVERQLAR